MSVFGIIITVISGSIFSAILAAIFSISNAFVLQLLTRLVAKFKLSYLAAYSASFLSWFTALIFQVIGSLLSAKFEIVEIPGATPHTPWNKSLIPPGAISKYVYIMAILALLVISIIYSMRIDHPDTGPIGICRGFLIALINAILFILFVIAIVGTITLLGP
jgi:hypothetical protein